MTILRLDLSAGGWRAVPPRIFEDQRLSLDTRGVAGFISTRSETFRLSVGGLCTLLSLGGDKWRRMSGELADAGYLKRVEGKDERGRFRHELLFSPIPEGGFPGKTHGRSVAGHPKVPARPGTANAVPVAPSPAPQASTGETSDPILNFQKSNNHHQPPGGGGEAGLTCAPTIWVDAANFEIGVEEQVRQVRNRGGLLKTILARYQANGGPADDVLEAIRVRRAGDREQLLRAAAAESKAKKESERAQAELDRLVIAENKAADISPEERLNLFLAASEGLGWLRAGHNAKTAFVTNGKILPGPIRSKLVQLLLSRS